MPTYPATGQNRNIGSACWLSDSSLISAGRSLFAARNSPKVLFGMALRQTTGFLESLLRLIGLGWA